jgi:hypothetical protein
MMMHVCFTQIEPEIRNIGGAFRVIAQRFEKPDYGRYVILNGYKRAN